jgi:hypothetical protein
MLEATQSELVSRTDGIAKSDKSTIAQCRNSAIADLRILQKM